MAGSILAQILERKQAEVAALRPRAAELRRTAESAPAPVDFVAALRENKQPGSPALIAELKRASPSKGLLAPGLDLLDAAGIYAANGASAVSVLTDEHFFLGSLDTLRALKFERGFPLPLLRKDFIIDPLQLYETRAAGADAALLIAAALPENAALADLHALALELGLTALVEVHDAAETERVMHLPGLRLVGVNNRNLATFEVALETSERLHPLIPAGVSVVAESGIFSAADVQRLARAGVDAVLVGEALVTAADIPAKVREIAGLRAPASDLAQGQVHGQGRP
jgi:indole-3-glycerol phosphate synthase